jgi:hypothetical protein
VKNLPTPSWAGLISSADWAVCDAAISAMRQAGIDFLLGGAFGMAFYTGKLRRPTDIDLFVLPANVPGALKALSAAGFVDYFFQKPYERSWRHRWIRDGFTVDLIFGLAHGRAVVDLLWFAQAREIMLHGERVKIAPPEEMLWKRLYVLQRDHCEWPDILNLLCAVGSTLDWNHLCNRVGDDLPLLRAVLNLNDWLCPEGSGQIPASVRDHLRLPPRWENPEPGQHKKRVGLIDSRKWFAADAESDELLEI